MPEKPEEDDLRLTPATQSVLSALPSEWTSAAVVADKVKAAGGEFVQDTITRSLNDLVTKDMAEKSGPRNSPIYRKFQ